MGYLLESFLPVRNRYIHQLVTPSGGGMRPGSSTALSSVDYVRHFNETIGRAGETPQSVSFKFTFSVSNEVNS